MTEAQVLVRVALVEDDLILREELGDYLRQQGFAVTEFTSGVALTQEIQRLQIHLVILDVNLPGHSGFEIAARLRQTQAAIGIVMLTARGALADRVAGYDSGADVFLPKPAQPRELVAVLMGLHRRLSGRAHELRLVLDARKRVLSAGEGQVALQLTVLEAALLVALAQAEDGKLDTASLSAQIEAATGGPAITRRALENTASRLRKKVAASGLARQEQLLKPIWGWGYQLGVGVSLE